MNQPATPPSGPQDDDVQAYEPNCRMKDTLGEDFSLHEAISESVVAACAGLLDKASQDFFHDAEADLQALESLCRQGDAKPASYELLQLHAYNIKSHAKVLGFTLITELCAQIVAAIRSRKLPDDKKRPLIAKLVEGLRLTFANHIRDDGGSSGQALRDKLTQSL